MRRSTAAPPCRAHCTTCWGSTSRPCCTAGRHGWSTRRIADGPVVDIGFRDAPIADAWTIGALLVDVGLVDVRLVDVRLVAARVAATAAHPPTGVSVPTTLVVTNDFPPRIGGIERFVEQVCGFCDDDVIVLTSSEPGAAAYDARLPYEVVRRDRVLLPTASVA